MNSERAAGRLSAAFAVGLIIGAATSAGTALLLYTGQGFLRAAGLLVASTLMAVAAGLWAGGPEDPKGADPDVKRDAADTAGTGNRHTRWVIAAVVLLVGGAFAAIWTTRAPLRELAPGGALAVLLLLAMPAYAAGALLAGMTANGPRRRSAQTRVTGVTGVTGTVDTAWPGAMATTATAGSALGVLLATTTLIPSFDAWAVYVGAAALTAIASLFDRSQSDSARSDRAGSDRARSGDTVRNLSGRVVIVTGVGSRGQLGYTVAERFLDAGANVVITGRSAAFDDAASSFDNPERLLAVRADLLRDDEVSALIERTYDRFGRIDALINVAGGLSIIDTVEDTTPEEWIREIERNAGTALRVSRAALPLLRVSGGAIVNFASPAAADAPARLAAYSAAKAAVVALTQALAREERDNGVRVNAIAPGTMDTDQNRETARADAVFVKRIDVAERVLDLVMPDNAETGQVVTIR